ncbi:hypothetical protein HYH96_04800 [Clostridium botulinum]|uniref:hypothetical protein n=1 Tax=Clostridium botulinum TaxID=1491 RepID=UPI00174A7E43|nr:hypothetical protein [Clostridium botulinum]MBD5643212.1 hypothetical protein [Clostridium botulinum]
MEHGFVKVLKLDQRNLDNKRKVINVKEENVTKLSSYNFLIKTLETYNNKKFKKNEQIKEFIKINLSTTEEEAKTQWFDGIEYDGKKYVAWFATVGGMKKEGNGICDTIFIREDYQEFAELVEKLISLGKFKEIENLEDDNPNKMICINKDVLSRISLITSDLITEIEMPNFIVLPSTTYHIVKDYKTVEPFTYIEKKENEKGEIEEIEHIDYNLVDVHFDDDIDVFDGGGIATSVVFNRIGNVLGRKNIDFAIIRGYGSGIKGLITRFNIMKYLDTFYKEDTDYCRKINGQYQLLDRWKDWQTVTEDTILLNDSMVKLAKYFKNIEEYKTLLKKQDEKYRGLLNKLYITKVNKPSYEITDYRRANYQLINGLALTPYQYNQLINQDVKVFTKLLKPYKCVKGEGDTKEFIANTDYINLFYRQCTNINLNEKEEIDEDDLREICETVVNKTHELININPEFVKLDYVKKNLRRLIEKKVRELALGKVTIKAKYQYIAIDPISYMNYAMYREQGDNGLKEGEFYSSDCEDGDIRTIQRNPLSAYSEVHNVKFVKNNFFDNWLSDCKELIYFNQKSDILSLLSSADCDGDACTVIDEPIMRNAVIVPKDRKYFITKNDGKKKPLLYNKENRFVSTYLVAGNLIGSIALKSANVNCDCQMVPSYYDTVNKKFIDYIRFKVDMEMDNDWTKEEINKFIDEKLESKEWIKGYSKDCEKELFEYQKQKYYEYEKEIYTILYNSMMAIDAPKTLVFPSKNHMEVIDKKYHSKVNFLKYKENKDNVIEKQYYVKHNNLLDFFAGLIQKKLLNIIENNVKEKPKFSRREDLLQKQLKNENYCKETYDLCFSEVEKLYKEYTDERKKAEKNESNKNNKLWKDMMFHQNEVNDWDQFMEDEYWGNRKLNKQEKYKEYKEIDKKYIPEAQKLLKIFDTDTISQAIANLEKCTEDFILSLFFNCLKNKGARYVYQKFIVLPNQKEEDFDIEYLYEKYKKIEVKDFDNSKNIDSLVQEDKLRLKLEKKVRFRMFDNSIIKEIEDRLEDGEYILNLIDERVQAFEEFQDVIKDKETVKIIKFDNKKNGELEISKKSFGVIIEG